MDNCAGGVRSFYHSIYHTQAVPIAKLPGALGMHQEIGMCIQVLFFTRVSGCRSTMTSYTFPSCGIRGQQDGMTESKVIP